MSARLLTTSCPSRPVDLDDRYGADGHPNSAMRAFAGDENLFQNDSEPVFQPDPPQPPGNPGDAKIDPRKKGW